MDQLWPLAVGSEIRLLRRGFVERARLIRHPRGRCVPACRSAKLGGCAEITTEMTAEIAVWEGRNRCPGM